MRFRHCQVEEYKVEKCLEARLAAGAAVCSCLEVLSLSEPGRFSKGGHTLGLESRLLGAFVTIHRIHSLHQQSWLAGLLFCWRICSPGSSQ